MFREDCIVQNRRFVVIEDMGCLPATPSSVVSVIILWFPPLIFCIAALVLLGMSRLLPAISARTHPLAVMTVRDTWRRRHILASGLDRSGMASPTFQRLLITCAAAVFILTCYIVFMTVASGANGFNAWTSWADVHSHMSEVEVVNSGDIPMLEQITIELSWWIVPMLSVFVFGLLGFGKERGLAMRRWLRRPSVDCVQLFTERAVLHLALFRRSMSSYFFICPTSTDRLLKLSAGNEWATLP